jgi:hypothetical protein
VLRTSAAAAGGCLCLSAASGAVSPAQSTPAPQLAATVTPTELTLGAAATVTGSWTSAGAGIAGTTLSLQVRPYPYRPPWAALAGSPTGPDGTFSFPLLHPDRNTRLQLSVPSPGPVAGATVNLQIYVDPRASLTARSIGPGRTRLSLRIRHAVFPHTVDGTVRWFVAAGGSRVFHLAGQTQASELRRGLLDASTVVDPPSRRFAFRACVNPSWERAMGPPAAHRPCPTAGFVLPPGHAG